MNTKKTLLTVVVLVVVLVGWIFFRNSGDVAVNTPTPTISPTSDSTSSPQATPTVSPESTTSPSPAVLSNVITYTDSGYTPNTITIKIGETVTWKNESSNSMWTASAAHPTHKVYPGTDIANCGTSAGLNQFDACTGVVSGQSWSFKFDNTGTWGYHNHRNSSKFGKVIVE